MKNSYEIRGEITAIIIVSPKYGRQEALISTSKLDIANEFPNTFNVGSRGNTLYVQGHMPRVNGVRKTITLHNWITETPKGLMVDHIDHNGLNNTDDNLRIVTNAENQQNRISANSSSKSGVRGVVWKKSINKWIATIKINQVMKYIGQFESVEEAKTAVIKARAKYMQFSQESVKEVILCKSEI